MDYVEAVENIVKHKFKDKRLLMEALTRYTSVESPSNQRLEFFGDSALNHALTQHIYLSYPNLRPDEMTQLRTANISNEKFARVAVKHGLYQFLQRKSRSIDQKVKEFSEAVSKEDDTVMYGGLVKAPKILADLVESIAGAVYVDVNFDLRRFWMIFKGILDPIVTLDEIQQQPEPITRLNHLCHKQGKQIDFRFCIEGTTRIAEVYVDNQFVASGHAKLLAAKEALRKLCVDDDSPEVEKGSSSLHHETTPETIVIDDDSPEVEDAKGKLKENGSSSLHHEMTPETIVIDDDSPEVEDAKGKLKENGSSSLRMAPGNSLSYKTTPETIVIDDDSQLVKPGDANGKLFVFCATEKPEIQYPLTYEMTQIDKDSLKVTPENAKMKLNAICSMKKWPNPVYSIEEENITEKGYVCRVKIEIPTAQGTYYMKGDRKPKRKQAESSSAYHMIRALKTSTMAHVVGSLETKKSLEEKKKLIHKEKMQQHLEKQKLIMQKFTKKEKILENAGLLRRSKRIKLMNL